MSECILLSLKRSMVFLFLIRNLDSLAVKISQAQNSFDAQTLLEVIEQQANEGHVDFQLALGKLYVRGAYFVHINEVTALEWLNKASRSGNSEAAGEISKVISELNYLHEC